MPNTPFTTFLSKAAMTPRPRSSHDATRQALTTAIHESNDILASATCFGLFPDTITVDRAQVTITKRMFLRTADTTSLRIEDIFNVVATVGPVFGSLKFFGRIADLEVMNINYLWRSDALRLKRLIQGYVVAIQRQIDCSHLSTPELVQLLDKLDTTD